MKRPARPGRGHIAVYPALERYDRAARYALVVGIRAPETGIDLYTEVANRIGVPITVET